MDEGFNKGFFANSTPKPLPTGTERLRSSRSVEPRAIRVRTSQCPPLKWEAISRYRIVNLRRCAIRTGGEAMMFVRGNVFTSGGVHRVSFSLVPGAESALCISPCNRSHEWCASDASTTDCGYGHILRRVFSGHSPPIVFHCHAQPERKS